MSACSFANGIYDPEGPNNIRFVHDNKKAKESEGKANKKRKEKKERE